MLPGGYFASSVVALSCDVAGQAGQVGRGTAVKQRTTGEQSHMKVPDGGLVLMGGVPACAMRRTHAA